MAVIFIRKERVNMNDILIFDIKSMDDQTIDEFYKFFKIYNLDPLFNNEHRTSQIHTSHLDMRSVINPNNKYHKILKTFTDYLHWASDNKSYEEAIFRIIDESNSMGALMNKIKKINDFIENEIWAKHLFNTWNIVWYNKELK